MEEQINQPQNEAPKQEPEVEVKETKNDQSDQKDIEENKLWAIMGYLGVLCLVPLLAKKDSKFAQFHAKQGLIMFIGEFLVWIPLFGWLLGIVLFIFWIKAIIDVLSGKMTPLPIIGELAGKLNI